MKLATLWIFFPGGVDIRMQNGNLMSPRTTIPVRMQSFVAPMVKTNVALLVEQGWEAVISSSHLGLIDEDSYGAVNVSIIKGIQTKVYHATHCFLFKMFNVWREFLPA